MITEYKVFENNNLGIYNVCIETVVYSLTEEQYQKAKMLLDQQFQDKNKFYDGLDYIVKVGKEVIQLDGVYSF